MNEENPLPTNSPIMSLSSRIVDPNQQPPIELYKDIEEMGDGLPLAQGEDVTEDDIRRTQKMDIVSTISSLRLTTSDLSRMCIPLCHLVPMPMVHPTLACDLILLEQQFVHGYEDGARVFYVSIVDEQGQSSVFTEAEKEKWGPLWNSVNDHFNMNLRSKAALKHLVDYKFFICDGNHRRIAWMNHIERLHKMEREWHLSVDSIVLDTKNRIGVAMQLMHDINKHTENSHVKTNLVHTLYRVQKYGVMELEKFNELLSSDEVKTCQLSTQKTWYTMLLEVFTSFIFKQEIAAAADNAVRKFNEDTSPDERSKEGVAATMRTAIKESTEKLYKKLSKIVAVANPAFGPEFLQEIERHWSLYSVPELTLDKLQMIATANVNTTFKVRWLRWINGSGPSREARRFPARPVNEDKLLQFLAKACWYAGMEEAAIELFESIIRTDNIRIDMSVSSEPLTLLEYMEGWQMKLWDDAYTGVFKGADAFKKSDSFKEFRGALLAVKRLIYRTCGRPGRSDVRTRTRGPQRPVTSGHSRRPPVRLYPPAPTDGSIRPSAPTDGSDRPSAPTDGSVRPSASTDGSDRPPQPPDRPPVLVRLDRLVYLDRHVLLVQCPDSTWWKFYMEEISEIFATYYQTRVLQDPMVTCVKK